MEVVASGAGWPARKGLPLSPRRRLKRISVACVDVNGNKYSNRRNSLYQYACILRDIRVGRQHDNALSSREL